MKFEKYNLFDEKGNSNCIIRTFSKLFNREYDDIKKELLEISKKLNLNDYKEVKVFETFLNKYNFISLENINDIQIKDLKLPNGKYAVFCWDKNNFYHMTTIINNIVYDKNNSVLELYVLKIYKEK